MDLLRVFGVLVLLGGCGTTDLEEWSQFGGETPLAHEVACRSVTPAGSCNVVDQCGCGAGEGCFWGLDDESGDLYETCLPVDGTLAVGEACDPSGAPPYCRPGSTCVDDGAGATCLEWCLDTGDCSLPGMTCEVSVTWGAITYPYDVCTHP